MDLPRETTTLEGFEAWNRRRRAPEHEDNRATFVSIRADGTICISKAAYEKFGSPDAVQLMFDRRRRRIGLKPVEPDTDRGWYSSNYLLTGSNNLVSCRKFLEHYGVALAETRRYTPKLIDDVLVVDL